MKYASIILFFAFAVAGAIWVVGSSVPPPRLPVPQTHRVTGSAFGTAYTLQWVSPYVTEQYLAPRASAILSRMDARISNYRVDSEISRFNAAPANEWVRVDSETLRIVRAALALCEETSGTLDVSIDPLLQAWGFGPHPRRQTIPTDSEIDAARARVDWRKIGLRADPPALRKSVAGMQLDLSAVGEGCAIDALCAELEALKVENYFVELGGEMRARGRNAKDRAWRAGIETPQFDYTTTAALAAVLELDGLALSTSGTYRNFIERDGRRYPHILDPRNGRPVEHNLFSVSVIDPSAMRADGLATGLLVMGPEAAYAFAERHTIPVLLMINENGSLRVKPTPAFDQYRAKDRARESGEK